jgi:2-polyprenyl-3-methyl-5-hydroxy-6-metoxy-1,4-benzoquinol methylase
MGSILKDEISQNVNSLLIGKDNIKVLEAGCGSASHFCFMSVKKIVGIDISQEELDRNTVIQEKILGNIETYSFPKKEYDVVVCWDVLEHLSKPGDALRNLFCTVKPEGLIILGFPNLISFKGILTKVTPYWLHRYILNTILGIDSLPVPTYLRFAMHPIKVIKLAEENGFSVVFYKVVEGGVSKKMKERYRLIRLTFSTINMLLCVISMGKCPSLFLDSCSLILLKCADLSSSNTCS